MPALPIWWKGTDTVSADALSSLLTDLAAAGSEGDPLGAVARRFLSWLPHPPPPSSDPRTGLRTLITWLERGEVHRALRQEGRFTDRPEGEVVLALTLLLGQGPSSLDLRPVPLPGAARMALVEAGLRYLQQPPDHPPSVAGYIGQRLLLPVVAQAVARARMVFEGRRGPGPNDLERAWRRTVATLGWHLLPPALASAFEPNAIWPLAMPDA